MKSTRSQSRSPRLSLWLASLTAAGLLPLGATGLSAQTVTTWNGGTGNWSNGTLWSTGVVPNGAAYDVFIDGGKPVNSVVTLDGAYTFGRLTLDAGDTINILDNLNVTISNGAFAGSGSLVNNGTINFNSTNVGTYLHFNGAGAISGTGTINLNGPNARIFTNTTGDRLTIGAGQTVAGTGNLGSTITTFTNNGTVTANQNGKTLLLQPGGGTADFTNVGAGAARAENGGVLELASGTFSGNTFTALAGSTVKVDSGATVSGATLTGSGTGVVTLNRGCVLTNVTLTGNATAPDNTEFTSNGTLTNNGTLTLNSTNVGVYLHLGGPSTLAGTGTINLGGSNARILADTAGDRLTIGAGQTIQGAGILGNGTTTFTNNGTINANTNGGTLTLQPGGGTADFTNAAGGVLQASNGGTLALSGASGGVFNLGGTVQALTGSTIQIASGANISGTTFTTAGTGVVTLNTATLTNVTSNGTLNVLNKAQPVAVGTLTNKGTLNLNSTGDGVFLRLAGAVSLSGTGTTNLVGANVRIFANTAGDRLTIGGGQTIAGAGNLGNGSTTFTNNGIIDANTNGGTLTIQPGGGTADFINNGFVLAEKGGTLALSNASGGKFTNNSFFEADAGSTFNVPAGALTNFSGTTLTGGTYYVSSSNAANPATLSLGGGSIVTNNANIFLDGPGAVFNELNALANNASGGTIDLAYGRNFTTAGALTNAGDIDVSGGSKLTVSGAFNNSGLTEIDGSSTNTTSATIQGNVTNSGTLAATVSTITVQGTLTNNGALQAGFSGQAGTIAVTGALTQSTAGILLGSGTVTAPTLTLAGSLRPGDSAYVDGISSAVGKLTLNGQVGLLSSTTLVFDLAGTTMSDQITVGGALTLDGTLTVNALAGFGVGRYDLIDYTGLLTDNGLELGTLPSGYNYAIDTSIAGQVDLVVTSVVPEPSTWAGVLLGLGLLSRLRRRSRA